jgi:hypothetical protein
MRTLLTCVFLLLAGFYLGCDSINASRDGRFDNNLLLPLAAVGTNDAIKSASITIPQVKKEWTVMVYMCADNNLTEFSDGDIYEMMKSGSNENMNIVVLWDNLNKANPNSGKVRNGYYYVKKGSVTLLRNCGEVNMGDPCVAKEFIDYSLKNFPAKKYFWIWWNHGGAVDRSMRMKGIAWDDSGRNDHLSESEQKAIMEHFIKSSGRKVDIVGFDACLMATAELAYQYRTIANYIVASEETIAGEGWDYNFLGETVKSPTMSARTMAKNAFSYYKLYYRDSGEPATLSVFYLAHAARLASELNIFSSAAMKSGNGAIYRTLATEAHPFGVYDSGSGNGYYTRDLYGFMNIAGRTPELPAAVRESAKRCADILADGKFIPYEWHSKNLNSEAYGVSVTLKYATDVYRTLDICRDTKWDEFLNWAKFPNSDNL